MNSQMTFLYFDHPQEAHHFFEHVLCLEPVFDPGWARVYRVANDAYLGAVSRSEGSLVTPYSGGVLVSLTVDDVQGWHQRILEAKCDEVTPIKHFEALGLRSFFFKGPEGYDFEIQCFEAEDIRALFEGGSR